VNVTCRYLLDEALIPHLHALYQGEWWSKGRTIEDITVMLEHTDVVIVLQSDEGPPLAGFARVLTDRVYKALILDVIVHPDYRGTGLGADLMGAIREHPDLQQVRHFELYCAPEMEPFYEKWGFTHDLGNLSFMRFRSEPE